MLAILILDTDLALISDVVLMIMMDERHVADAVSR